MCDERGQQPVLSTEEMDTWRRNGDAISDFTEVAETPKGVLEELKEPGVRD